MASSKQQNLIFELDNETRQENDQEWYQENLDLFIPLLIITVGLFQFILRKWILPVSEATVSQLENQLPTQGIIYRPEFGAFLIIVGFILLLIFNI